MVFLREALTLIAGLALTKAIVDRTIDEPDTPDILPKLPEDRFTPLTREEQIEEKLRDTF